MLHDNLKALRKAAGISQEELAIRLHVVRQTISKWEKGVSQSLRNYLQTHAYITSNTKIKDLLEVLLWLRT